MNVRVGLCSHGPSDQAVLAAIRDAGFAVAFHVVPTEGVAACRSLQPEILLISQGEGVDLAAFRRLFPQMKLVILLDRPDFHLARQARWQGAAEVLLLPDDLGQLPLLLPQLVAGATFAAPATPTNKLILVSSPKGGCGGSTVAAGLALALAPEAILVDLDLTYGSAETLLNLTADRSVLDLAPLAAELEERHVLQAITPHPSGLAVLCAPASGSPADRLTVEEAQAILQVCRRHWSHVVVDLPGGNVELLAALGQAADQVLVVTTPDPIAMRAVHLLQKGGGLPLGPQVGLVVNHWTRRAPFKSEQVASRLGLPLLAQIPEDALLAERVALGNPIVPVGCKRLGRAGAALVKLAEALSPKKGRRGA